MTINTQKMQKILNLLNKKILFIGGLAIATIITYADQISKLWATKEVEAIMAKTFGVHQHIQITSFFNLVKVKNTGVSFGMFNGANNGNIILLFVTMIITAIVTLWLWQNKSKYLMFALSFILGGAVGNIIDRFNQGAVSDFLDFHLKGYHWPAFNLADAMITIGVIMIVLDEFFFHTADKKKKLGTNNEESNDSKEKQL